MNWIEALILGIVQGLTEFLPVSSSGHLEIGSILLRVDANGNLLFAIVVHLATALATMLVFRTYIVKLVLDILKFQPNESTRFILLLLVSMLPVSIAGLFFKDWIEAFFRGDLLLVGSALLITGGLLLFAHYKKNGVKSVGLFSALIIGMAQSVAVLPGISRSGATISTALILGVERDKAAKFSFLMVILPIFGASLLQLKYYVEDPSIHQIGAFPLIIGFLAAFISGFLACKWMIKIIEREKLTHFAIYCFIVGLIAIISGL
ncbi:MAG: undecaprenyl-diphosphate phosphatase [Bacteroidota bacterium]